jgi:hypothetical protein
MSSNPTTGRPNTRQEHRKNGTNVPIESIEEIKDAGHGRIYLEKGLYLCPQGEPVTPTSIKYCLHQISMMPGITVPIAKAVRATALLVEEFEEYSVAETIRDTVDKQLNALTEDLQLLTTDVKGKIDDRLEKRLTELDEHTNSLGKMVTKIETATTNVANGSGTNTSPPNGHHQTSGAKTYAEALITPPAYADPKLAAKEGIRARQFMLEGIVKGSELDEMSELQK